MFKGVEQIVKVGGGGGRGHKSTAHPGARAAPPENFDSLRVFLKALAAFFELIHYS